MDNKLKKAAAFKPQVIIVGAGASGLMCAIEAGKRGRRVLVTDRSNSPGTKILMAGGGKCNFTNYFLDAENFVSDNPHFCKSAISRFTQWDFISLIEKHKIRYEEREHGQLFCKNSSRDILDMLLKEATKNDVRFLFNTHIENISKKENMFSIKTNHGRLKSESIVIATGGPSVPSSGATGFGYEMARKFNIDVTKIRPGLVPLTLQPGDKKRFESLSGISVDAVVKNNNISFSDRLLFTHRGLSGPVILKISLYFKPGTELIINTLPGINIKYVLTAKRKQGNNRKVKNLIPEFLPRNLVEVLINERLKNISIKSLNEKDINDISRAIHELSISPGGTEGFRTAEVALGGVNCNEISSKTMESGKVKALYFTGEVLDVTGWLGGYNLQWAWSSGWCAGQFV